MLVGVKFVVLHDRFGLFVLGLDIGEFGVFESVSLLFLLSIGNLWFNVLVKTLLDVLEFKGLFLFSGASIDLRVGLFHVRFGVLLDSFCGVRGKVVRGV